MSFRSKPIRWGNLVRSEHLAIDKTPSTKEKRTRFSESDEVIRPSTKSAPQPVTIVTPTTGYTTPLSEITGIGFTPTDMMSLSGSEDELDMEDENEDLSLLKTPMWRQLSSVYENADVSKMGTSEGKLFFRRTSASSIDIRWKHIFPAYSGRYTLQEYCEDWTDIYKGNLCRWEIVGMEQEKKHRFRVINDRERIVTAEIEITLHKQSSVAEILGRAIATNDYAKIALICQSRPQPNINVPDASGMSPLMRACAMSRLDIVKTLLECGADVNFGNSANKTCAMIASLVGNVQVIETLVEHSANLRLRDRSGATSLHYAIDSGKVEVVRYLLTQRVDVDAQDNQGWTPLMCLAANRGTMEIANTLIKAGSDVNYSDNIGKTVLMSASLAGNREMCELLVKSGAVHSAYTRFGKSAYEMAVAFDRKEVVEFFQNLKKKRNSVSLGVSTITF